MTCLIRIAHSLPCSCNRRVQACSDGAKIGYSGDHVPVISKSLADVYDATLIEGDDVDILGSKTTIDCRLYLGEMFSFVSSMLHSFSRFFFRPLQFLLLFACVRVRSLLCGLCLRFFR